MLADRELRSLLQLARIRRFLGRLQLAVLGVHGMRERRRRVQRRHELQESAVVVQLVRPGVLCVERERLELRSAFADALSVDDGGQALPSASMCSIVRVVILP